MAALSAKEATDQAQTLQMVKRLIFVACKTDQDKTNQIINQSWQEAVDRVRKRGRNLPPEAMETLQATVEDLEKKAALDKVKADLEKTEEEYNKVYQENYRNAQDLSEVKKEAAVLRAQLEREIWVGQQLEQQGVLGRRTAAEFRQAYNDRFRERQVTS